MPSGMDTQTDRQTDRHTHTDAQTKAISRTQACTAECICLGDNFTYVKVNSLNYWLDVKVTGVH